MIDMLGWVFILTGIVGWLYSGWSEGVPGVQVLIFFWAVIVGAVMVFLG